MIQLLIHTKDLTLEQEKAFGEFLKNRLDDLLETEAEWWETEPDIPGEQPEHCFPKNVNDITYQVINEKDYKL